MSSEQRFSSFWPLLIVLVTILTLQVVSLVGAYNQKGQLNSNIEQLSKADEDIKKVDTALGSVSKDLIELSATNAVAKQVITEFQIRQNAPTP